MAEYDVAVTLQVVIEADSREEAEDIAIKNIQILRRTKNAKLV